MQQCASISFTVSLHIIYSACEKYCWHKNQNSRAAIIIKKQQQHAWCTKAQTDAEKIIKLHSWSSLRAAELRMQDSGGGGVRGDPWLPLPSRFLTVLMPTLAREEWRLAAVQPASQHGKCLQRDVPLVILELYLMFIRTHQWREEGRQWLRPVKLFKSLHIFLPRWWCVDVVQYLP